jgi:hypothetical protein
MGKLIVKNFYLLSGVILTFVCVSCRPVTTLPFATSASLPPTTTETSSVPTKTATLTHIPPTKTVTPSPTITPTITETVTPSATPIVQIPPAEPPKIELEFSDVSSREFWQDKSILGGDMYDANFFERPFTTEMVYLPDVDILKAAIATDTEFLYFTITLSEVNKTTGDFQGQYGVELDVNKDGRGDYSIWALNPTSTFWMTTGVTVLADINKDVGGLDPAQSERGWKGDGYETTIPNTNPEAAWARVSLANPVMVQIAVHRKLIGEPKEFLWGVWGDNGLKNPQQFDYDDFYNLKEAGSGFFGNIYYPLNIIHSCDNTCRQPYGFIPNQKIANACYAGTASGGSTPIDCSKFQIPNCPPGCGRPPVGGSNGTCVAQP